MLSIYKNPWRMTALYELDGLKCDLLLGKQFLEEIICLFRTQKFGSRSLEP